MHGEICRLCCHAVTIQDRYLTECINRHMKDWISLPFNIYHNLYNTYIQPPLPQDFSFSVAVVPIKLASRETKRRSLALFLFDDCICAWLSNTTLLVTTDLIKQCTSPLYNVFASAEQPTLQAR